MSNIDILFRFENGKFDDILKTTIGSLKLKKEKNEKKPKVILPQTHILLSPFAKFSVISLSNNIRCIHILIDKKVQFESSNENPIDIGYLSIDGAAIRITGDTRCIEYKK